MDLLGFLISGLWAGFFASGLGVLFTAPTRFIAPAFFCGFAGRFARDVLVSWGLAQNWSTAVAAAVVVFVAVAVIRGHLVAPVVLVSGVLPLGASMAMFHTILGLMKVSTLQGEALSEASVALSANAGKAFTTSLAIALGLGAGVVTVRLFRREEVREGV